MANEITNKYYWRLENGLVPGETKYARITTVNSLANMTYSRPSHASNKYLTVTEFNALQPFESGVYNGWFQLTNKCLWNPNDSDNVLAKCKYQGTEHPTAWKSLFNCNRRYGGTNLVSKRNLMPFYYRINFFIDHYWTKESLDKLNNVFHTLVFFNHDSDCTSMVDSSIVFDPPEYTLPNEPYPSVYGDHFKLSYIQIDFTLYQYRMQNQYSYIKSAFDAAFGTGTTAYAYASANHPGAGPELNGSYNYNYSVKFNLGTTWANCRYSNSGVIYTNNQWVNQCLIGSATTNSTYIYGPSPSGAHDFRPQSYIMMKMIPNLSSANQQLIYGRNANDLVIGANGAILNNSYFCGFFVFGLGAAPYSLPACISINRMYYYFEPIPYWYVEQYSSYMVFIIPGYTFRSWGHEGFQINSKIHSSTFGSGIKIETNLPSTQDNILENSSLTTCNIWGKWYS